jgi:hypothetical protein
MATTTFEAIRDKQIQVVEALTPTAHSGVKFEAARDEQDFREWASSHRAAAFRRFTIVNAFDYQAPEVDTHDVVFERMTAQVVVAYPVGGGRYGAENRRDMRDLIDTDFRQIDRALGPYGQNLGNWVDGQSLCLRTSVDVSEDGDIFFLLLNYEIGFYRAR